MNRHLPLLTIILLVSTFALTPWLKTGIAQHPARKAVITNKIPAHVPLAVTIRNLDHDQYWSDLEIEVKNTGTKPIYYLILSLEFPELRSADKRRGTGIPLAYGRAELIDVNNRPTPDDIPLRPGESHVFKIRKSIWVTFEHVEARTDISDEGKRKLELIFSTLNFGDGTGLGTTAARPLREHRISKNGALRKTVANCNKNPPGVRG